MAVEEWTREEWAAIQEAARAARHGGDVPDAILMRLTPRYHVSAEHTRRYHRMADAMRGLLGDWRPGREPNGRHCVRCGHPLVGPQQTTCGPVCAGLHAHYGPSEAA